MESISLFVLSSDYEKETTKTRPVIQKESHLPGLDLFSKGPDFELTGELNLPSSNYGEGARQTVVGSCGPHSEVHFLNTGSSHSP